MILESSVQICKLPVIHFHCLHCTSKYATRCWNMHPLRNIQILFSFLASLCKKKYFWWHFGHASVHVLKISWFRYISCKQPQTSLTSCLIPGENKPFTFSVATGFDSFLSSYPMHYSVSYMLCCFLVLLLRYLVITSPYLNYFLSVLGNLAFPPIKGYKVETIVLTLIIHLQTSQILSFNISLLPCFVSLPHYTIININLKCI